MLPLIGSLGTPELLILLVIVVLLFGASKLPELARGSGRALRIFKAETKGLTDGDDDDELKTPEQRQLDARRDATLREDPLRTDDSLRTDNPGRTDQTN